jgi:hypothetical protein
LLRYNSPSGWYNDDLGLAWLKEVFYRQIKEKARREYRLLLLDGHGFHLTMDFITFCDENKIILAVFPPHAMHKLQPLDVVLYGPLSEAYNKKLTTYLHNSQELLVLKKVASFYSSRMPGPYPSQRKTLSQASSILVSIQWTLRLYLNSSKLDSPRE